MQTNIQLSVVLAWAGWTVPASGFHSPLLVNFMSLLRSPISHSVLPALQSNPKICKFDDQTFPTVPQAPEHTNYTAKCAALCSNTAPLIRSSNYILKGY